jgi:hypothetical protein
MTHEDVPRLRMNFEKDLHNAIFESSEYCVSEIENLYCLLMEYPKVLSEIVQKHTEKESSLRFKIERDLYNAIYKSAGALNFTLREYPAILDKITQKYKREIEQLRPNIVSYYNKLPFYNS